MDEIKVYRMIDLVIFSMNGLKTILIACGNVSPEILFLQL